jgi:hypothetical protein
MRKKTIVGCILGFGLLAAPAARAASLSSTQASAILSLLQSFGADQGTINNVSAALAGSTTATTRCVDLSKNLILGASGSVVTKLQNYLIAQGSLDAQYNTGYYGIITAQAVGKLQLTLGILSSASDPAYGIVGPQTMRTIACNGTSSQPSNPPTATIDQSSLATNSVTPTITGTATNLSGIFLYITQPSAGFGAQGVVDANVPVVNGTWSYAIPSGDDLTSGTYQVNVQNLVTLTGLATGTLTIRASNPPTATIDQSSLATNSVTPTITGAARNLSEILLYITHLSASLGLQVFVYASVPVVNGTWSYAIPSGDGLTSGTYQVRVQDLNTLSGLATGTLIIDR